MSGSLTVMSSDSHFDCVLSVSFGLLVGTGAVILHCPLVGGGDVGTSMRTAASGESSGRVGMSGTVPGDRSGAPRCTRVGAASGSGSALRARVVHHEEQLVL